MSRTCSGLEVAPTDWPKWFSRCVLRRVGTLRRVHSLSVPRVRCKRVASMDFLWTSSSKSHECINLNGCLDCLGNEFCWLNVEASSFLKSWAKHFKSQSKCHLSHSKMKQSHTITHIRTVSDAFGISLRPLMEVPRQRARTTYHGLERQPLLRAVIRTSHLDSCSSGKHKGSYFFLEDHKSVKVLLGMLLQRITLVNSLRISEQCEVDPGFPRWVHIFVLYLSIYSSIDLFFYFIYLYFFIYRIHHLKKVRKNAALRSTWTHHSPPCPTSLRLSRSLPALEWRVGIDGLRCSDGGHGEFSLRLKAVPVNACHMLSLSNRWWILSIYVASVSPNIVSD